MISRIRLISFIVSIIVILSISREAESQRLGHYCHDNNTYYNPNGNGSSYRANLNFLLSTLTNASRTEEFYNFTAGLNTSAPTYGLYMCRGDVTGELCHSCMNNASRKILESCPNQTVAYIWFDICMLRYSNRPIISLLDRHFMVNFSNPNNVPAGELAGFKDALGNMLRETASRAANNSGSGKKFAIQEGNYSPFGTLYTLAQCTPDLSTKDCEECLTRAILEIPACCQSKQGGRVLFPSCNIRFETVKFYTTVDNPPSSGPAPPDVANNPKAPPPSTTSGKRLSVAVIIAIVASIIVSIVLFVLAFLVLKKRSKEPYGVLADGAYGDDMSAVKPIQYSFSEIQAATNNFDHEIGKGGFGVVFKGTLPNGKDIAVKRLSKSSFQGVGEFKNEILLLGKLQHRNLVRLLGFSFQGEESILIYEFVPNKSLDYFLFDQEKKNILDWSIRQQIIIGIIRGLLYLHRDSRDTIIHRDLKASNILLDENMNPKIADFGLARILGVDQSKEETSKVAGTPGYMSPEYLKKHQYSFKSDVYSFGVLVLEIISGKKSSNFYQSGLGEDLLSYTWTKWRDSTPLDVVDQQLGDSNSSINEILHYIHVGLLCVQDVEKRPTMDTVDRMLRNRSITLPAPHHPASFSHSKREPSRPRMEESDKSTNKPPPASVNETSMTELYPR